MDDTALVDRLRSDLHAERAATRAPDGLHVAGHRRWQRRRARRLRAGGALALVLVVGGAGLAAARVDDGEPLRTRRWGASAVTTTTAPEGPSQTPEDAARDGVDPEVAALPVSERVHVDVWSGAPPEGRYVISEVHSEVVLLDSVTDAIARAYPMDVATPTWLHVTSEEVFGGRIDPGVGPGDHVFRIDRRTGVLTGFLFDADSPTPPAGTWRPAPDGMGVDQLVTVGVDGPGERAVPWGDEIRVDVDALRSLFGLPPY
jgi:hypothetical protein